MERNVKYKSSGTVGRHGVASVVLSRVAIAALAAALCAHTGLTGEKAAATNAPVAAISGTNAAVPAETVRVWLDKWVEAEQMAAKERREAQQNKDILTARIDILKDGITAMTDKMAQADEKLKTAQKQKSEATAQIEQTSTAVDQLARDLSGLETTIRTLHPRLPIPLKDKIKTLYERMPADTNAVRVSVAERCQNVLGILNEINKFNSEITTVLDVRSLSDGKPSEVTCVYIGLGQAYSVRPGGGEAAVGRPGMGTQGWNWVQAPSSGEAIALTLEILQSKASPAFVPLPVEINK